MSVDTSVLSLRVDTGNSITDATSQLNQLSQSAGVAETRTKSLIAQVAALSSVFATNSASAQAFASTVTDLASNTSTKVTNTEAQQWDKLTRQYDSFQTKRIADAEKYFAQENKRLEAQYQKELKAEEDYANKSLAQETARLEKQMQLNARFASISASARYGTAKRASLYGEAGGDVESTFGSAVAAVANAEGIAKLKNEMEAASHSAHNFSLANAGVTRELVVMLGELQRGNISRFDGSMMVMANRMNVLQTLIKSFGVEAILAFAGFAVAAGALIAVIHAGEKEQNAFNMATILTGNYVGATRGELQQMAEAASKSSGTIGATKDVMLQLASSGAFTKDEIGKIAPVISNFSLVTGEAIGTVVADFEKLAKEPAKAIVELNSKYNFLTGAVYSQIAALEKQGDTQAAASLAEKTYAAAMAQRTEDILKHQGDIIRGWAAIKKFASEAWDAMINYGSSTAKQELEAVNAQLKNVNALMEKQKANRPGGVDEGVLAAYRDLLNKKKALEDEFNRADTNSIQAQLNRQDIAARERDEQDRLHNRTRAEIRKEEIAKAMEDFNSENAAQIGLQLAAHGKSVTELKEFVAQTGNVTLKAGQERIDYETEKSKKLLKLAQENGLALVKNEKDLADRIKEIQERHRDKGAIDDPGHQLLENSLNELKGALEKEKVVYEGNVKAIEAQEKTKEITVTDALKAITDEREKYRAKENAFYDASIKVLENYTAKHKTETAKIQGQIAGLKDQKEVSNLKMDNTESSDTDAAHAKELKYQEELIHEIDKRGQKDVDSYQKTLNAMQKHLEMLGLTKTEQAEMTASDARAAIAEYDSGIAALQMQIESGTLTGNQIKLEQEMISVLEAKKEVMSGIATTADKIAPAQAALDLEKLHTQEIEKGVQAAKVFEKEMVAAFGNVGKAIGGMSIAMAEYQKRMLAVENQKKAALKADTDGSKAQEILAQAAFDQQKNQFAMYGDMATAAQGFFKVGSKGYQEMQGVAQAFHVAQVAMNLIEMGQLAVKAVLAQGQGDPYSAWIRMAAMAAAVATLGFAVGGAFNSSSGDGTTAAERQATQGTGTVLGDANAKSKSITDSMALLSKNSTIGLQYSSQMLSALNSIDNAMTGVAAAIARSVGITAGNGFGIQEGTLSQNSGDPLIKMFGGFNDSSATKNLPILGNLIGGLQGLWGKVSQSITDSGIDLRGSLSNLANGGGMGQYANVSTTSSSFFGLVKNTKNSTQEKALDGELQQQFSLIFKGLDTAMKATASALGVNNANLSQQIDNFNLNIDKVSLKGLTGQALTDALNNVISAATDRLAQAVFPGLAQFQKAGEGYFQTAVRVANATEIATSELSNLGMKAINYTQIVNKQGDVGMEIVRQTLSLHLLGESLTGVLKIVNQFSGSASDLIKLYTQLVEVANAMEAVHLNRNTLTSSTVAGAGDLSTLQSGVKDYQANYFTATEQVQMETTELGFEFAKLGLIMPTTKEAFKRLVQNMDTSTEAGQRLQGGLLALSGAFSKLQDNVQVAKQTTIDGLNNQVSTLQSAQDALKAFDTSIMQFKNSLILGADSVLTPLQKLRAAQSQYETTLALAKTGDKTAEGQLQSAASNYLGASKTANSSSDAYTATYTKVQSDLAGIINLTSGKISDTQRQIDALNSQVSLLTNINATATAINNNIVAMNSVSQNSNAALLAQAQSNTNISTALITLSDQVAGLRQDQAQHTGAIIGATVASSDSNAQQVVTGVNQAAQRKAWINGQVQSVV